MYCHNTLYGPLTDTADSHSFFYISVGNPSILEATNSEIYDSRSDQIGYAFALFPQNSDIINFHHEDCGSILINLGTVLHSIQTLSNESLVLNYSEGSICDLKSKKPYSSSLQLICDKSELDGWPFLYRQRDECHYEFQWRTQYACPLCSSEEMTKIEGTCKSGTRSVKYIENENCLLLSENYVTYESCSEYLETATKASSILGLVIILLLMVVTTLMCICVSIQKGKYRSMQNKFNISD